MKIRAMRPPDLEAVRALHVHLFPVRYESDFFVSLLEDPSYVALVLAEERSGRIVGVATGFDRAKSLDCFGWNTVRTVYMSTFGVHADYRKRGLGSTLWTRFLEELCKSRSTLACVQLHVKTLNADAIAFYTRQGFRLWRRKPAHYKINGQRYDALKLALPLTAEGRALVDAPPSQPWLWGLCVRCCACCGKAAKSRDGEDDDLIVDDDGDQKRM